jgi:adenylylsulfate kinase-like enzyme
MQRDSKNLYKKVKSIKNFSKIGLTGYYEAPTNPDIKIDTSKESISNSVSKIIYKIF